MPFLYNGDIGKMLAEFANDIYGPLQYSSSKRETAPILDLKKKLAVDVLQNEVKKVRQADSQYLEGYKIVDSIVCKSGMAGTDQYFGCLMFKHSDWDLALKVMYAPFKATNGQFKSVMQYTHDKDAAGIKAELSKLWAETPGAFDPVWTWVESLSKERRIVVAFRGTKKIKDWVSNIDLLQSNFIWGNVHSGFLNIYSSGRAALLEKLKKLIPLDPILRQNTRLFITGHSLGGALATLCAADLYKEYAGAIPVPVCYTFASPRVASEVFASSFNTHIAKSYSDLGTTCSVRFFRPKDIVPTIPKGPLFKHVDNDYPLEGKDSSGSGGGVLAGPKPHGMSKYRELMQDGPAQ